MYVQNEWGTSSSPSIYKNEMCTRYDSELLKGHRILIISVFSLKLGFDQPRHIFFNLVGIQLDYDGSFYLYLWIKES